MGRAWFRKADYTRWGALPLSAQPHWGIGMAASKATTFLKGVLIVSAVLAGEESSQAGAPRARTIAIAASEFLSSVGICSTFPDRGQPIEKTIEMVKYVGFRWVRGGIEGLSERGPTTVETYLRLHRETGVKFSWGLVSGGTDIKKLIETGKQIAAAGALLAFEGNNEPNNWGVVYQGERGGGRAPSWMAVAKLQRDMYAAVKSDPVLKDYPVWGPSECGAETDNVGLQFLTIPVGAGCLMPDGTKYADFANCHNYLSHPSWPGLHDNQTWIAADPGPACKVDGLYGNHGRTWAKGFKGYSVAELEKLPRVTTETGVTIEGPFTEKVQGLLYMSVYLAQFKRGWRYTSIYILRDRTDEGGNQTFGFYRPDYTPRPAAIYLHNLLTVLNDTGTPPALGSLGYSITPQPETVHDLLLQKSDGTFALVVWGERFTGGSDLITVDLGETFPVVRIYDPTVGETPIKEAKDISSVELTMSDHPFVIEIPPRTARREKSERTAQPKPAAGTLRPSPEATAERDRQLLARMREELAKGRSLSFFSSSARERAEVLSIEEDALMLRLGSVRTAMAISKLSASDKARLALAVLREGTSSDHCLAAFYLLASGDSERGELQLLKADPEDAAQVRKSFE